jgi:hypothetical protein
MAAMQRTQQPACDLEALAALRFDTAATARLAGVSYPRLRALVVKGVVRPTRAGRIGRGRSSQFDVRATLALLLAWHTHGPYPKRLDLLAQTFTEYAALDWQEVAAHIGLRQEDPWAEEATAAATSDMTLLRWWRFFLQNTEHLLRVMRLGDVVRERLGLPALSGAKRRARNAARATAPR